MAATAMHITGMITPVDARSAGRRSVAGITPEFYFQKTIDNSRLVKISDPQRRREIRMFSASVAALFLVMMFYAWQHFSSIEYGYRVEAQKAERDPWPDRTSRTGGARPPRGTVPLGAPRRFGCRSARSP